MISRTTFTTSEGIELAADSAGSEDAPTVILLHGGGQTRYSWSGAMHSLAMHGYRVLSYDARGHGESDWSPTGDYSVRALASDLDAILSTVDQPTALVGASMGGMTSFYAIGRGIKPTVSALVMVDITLRPSAEGANKIQTFMTSHPDGFATLEDAADAVAAYNSDRPRPASSDGLRKNLRLRADGRLHWHWDPMLIAGMSGAESIDFARDLISVSDGVKLPTLLIRGGRSDIVDDACVEEMTTLVPQTEVYNVAGAGHMVVGDKNDAFNEGMIAFLGRHLPLR